LSSLFIGVSSCKNYYRNNSHKNVPLSSIEKGEALSVKYCQSCHLLPSPSLVDSKSWQEGVLPSMGPRLGIFQYDFRTYPSDRYKKNIGADFYPSKPLLNLSEWQSIIDYYTATSPDSLPAQHREHPIKMGLPLFTAEFPKFNYNNATSSCVKITSDTMYPIVTSDVVKKNIYFFNRQLEVQDSVHSKGSVVDMQLSKNEILACNIGNLNPNDNKLGKAEMIRYINQKEELDTVPLFDSLRRPVQITPADLNMDGKTDYLVCEFGNLKGALSWQENMGNDKFERHILRNTPGAIKAYISDCNHDGLPDVWVLFAQGEEGIFLFTNKGHGTFTTEEVLRFPPSYGSSYFEMDDFNNDGYPDVVYTCGDNADFSTELKPYHGVYIFLNDKTNHFKQKYFFPINGCYKAIARDFDSDGDLDIAVISFFADYLNQPEEGFVYLENKGAFDFYPYSLPEAKLGRWLTMDVADYDGDGKIDIILGNFSLGPSFTKSNVDWKHGPPFIILKNMSK
jgi:hypothetical protein